MSPSRAHAGRAPLRPANRRRRPQGPQNPPRRPGARGSGRAPADPAVVRARWLLLGLFGLTGLMFSSWLARIPAVAGALGMGTAELGGVLIVGSVGSLLTVSMAGSLVNRYGGRTALYLSTVAFSVAYVLIGLGPTLGLVPVLAVGIFLNGCAFALGNVPLNVETAAVERRLGRTVLPQFHAAFSIGSVVGSGVGALAAHAGVPLLWQFSATALAGAVWRVLSIPGAVLDSQPPPPEQLALARQARAARREAAAGAGRLRGVRQRPRAGAALSAWREPRTLLIGVVIMSAALSEGSANDWLALAVVDGFGQTEAVGAAMFGVFVGAMTAVRLLGTRLIDRLGRVTVLRGSGLVSLSGLLLFGLAPSLPLAAVGIVAWGFGAALVVPLGIAAASDDPVRAASRVAVVSAFSSTASLAAPPLLGLAAEVVGTRHALLAITVAMLISVLLASSVRRPEPAPGTSTPGGPTGDAPSAAVGPGTAGTGTTDPDAAEQTCVPTGRRTSPSATDPAAPTRQGATL